MSFAKELQDTIGPKVDRFWQRGFGPAHLELVLGQETSARLNAELFGVDKAPPHWQFYGLEVVVDTATPRLMAVRLRRGPRPQRTPADWRP